MRAPHILTVLVALVLGSGCANKGPGAASGLSPIVATNNDLGQADAYVSAARQTADVLNSYLAGNPMAQAVVKLQKDILIKAHDKALDGQAALAVVLKDKHDDEVTIDELKDTVRVYTNNPGFRIWNACLWAIRIAAHVLVWGTILHYVLLGAALVVRATPWGAVVAPAIDTAAAICNPLGWGTWLLIHLKNGREIKKLETQKAALTAASIEVFPRGADADVPPLVPKKV